jgi:hypothetical protein
MNILYEYRRQVRRGGRQINLLPKEELVGLMGFRSIFGFDEDAQAYIRQERTTSGLVGHNFYADELLVDFDDAWLAAESFAEDLAPYSYTMWDTGGRSIHFHVDIEPMYGPHTPYIHRAWMKEFAPGSDINIYKSSGIYRLPGTYHHKTVGARKVLLETNTGSKLELGDVRQDTWSGAHVYDDVDTDAEAVLNNLLMLPANEGGRNNRLFTIARLSLKCGDTYDTALASCLNWGSTFCVPSLSSIEVQATVQSVYKGRT